jgi:toxin HigB-1
VIKSFVHRGLKELFETGRTGKISNNLIKRARGRMLVLHAATTLHDLGIPGFDCHPLAGTNPQRYAIKVSGPWRITFEFKKGDALRVDLEQYH